MMLAAALTGCTGTGTQQESAGQTGQSQEESLAPAESQVSALAWKKLRQASLNMYFCLSATG